MTRDLSLPMTPLEEDNNRDDSVVEFAMQTKLETDYYDIPSDQHNQNLDQHSNNSLSHFLYSLYIFNPDPEYPD